MNPLEFFMKSNNFRAVTHNSVRTFTKRNLPEPGRGCQVFVGRLPIDAYEDEIFHFFSPVGSIYQIKLILNLSGETKGFGFVTFQTPADAQKAVNLLNFVQFRPNSYVYVSMSVEVRTLLLDNVESHGADRNALILRIQEVFRRIAQTEVWCLGASTFTIRFPQNHHAVKALNAFPNFHTGVLGLSVTLALVNPAFENQLELLVQERRGSPDSGFGSCQGSPGIPSPPREPRAPTGTAGDHPSGSNGNLSPSRELRAHSQLANPTGAAGSGYPGSIGNLTTLCEPGALLQLANPTGAAGSGYSGSNGNRSPSRELRALSQLANPTGAAGYGYPGSIGNLTTLCEPGALLQLANPTGAAGSGYSGSNGNLTPSCDSSALLQLVTPNGTAGYCPSDVACSTNTQARNQCLYGNYSLQPMQIRINGFNHYTEQQENPQNYLQQSVCNRAGATSNPSAEVNQTAPVYREYRLFPNNVASGSNGNLSPSREPRALQQLATPTGTAGYRPSVSAAATSTEQRGDHSTDIVMSILSNLGLHPLSE